MALLSFISILVTPIDMCLTQLYNIYVRHKKEVYFLTDKKMGRPTDNPKPNRITIRIDNETLNSLDGYCKKKSIERSEGVRRAIQKLDDK